MTSVDEALSYDRDAVGIGRKGTIDKPYLLKAPFWTVDTLFYAIPKSDIDLEFVHCSFLNVDWKSKDESTGLPSLSKEAINETIALVPSFNEQSQLGEFFYNLDSLITLHQRKCQYRGLCGYLSWEQRKLGEVASEFQSGEFISATEITENGDYPVYGGNGLRGYANRYNHEGFYALIGRQGALCGNVNCADGKAYFTEHAVAVQANQCNDTGFLVYLLSRMNLGQYSGQSAQPGLAVSTLKEVETLLPSKHEQYRIGSLLKDLDSLITLHQ